MKKQLIIGLSLLFCSVIQAQENGHYFSLNAGGGFHNLSYKLKNGSEKGSLGGCIDAGYSYFVNEQWGFHTGIGLQSYSPEATISYETETPSIDTDGESYEFQTYYKSWKEKQQLLFIDIPIGVQYRFGFSEKIRFLSSAGMKILIPVNTTYKTTGGEIVTTGYYSQYNVVLKDLPQHGFSTITDQFCGDISMKPSLSGYVEFGALYGLSSALDLYVGGYADYGLNNLAKSKNDAIYQTDGVYNGILSSNQMDKAKVMSLGFKVGIQWHFGGKTFPDPASWNQ